MTSKRIYILTTLMVATALNTQVAAQAITFEKEGEYARVGVYDTWEESPFRTGAIERPERYVGLAQNPDTAVDARTGVAPNPSATVLAVQRSRYGGNAFGVRIDLDQAFCLGTTAQTSSKEQQGSTKRFVHVMLYKPEGETAPAMLIGLGKRRDWEGQRPEVEQFWIRHSNPLRAGQWNDLVFPLPTHETVEIHSLVVVPDLASPHLRKTDFAAYIDDIIINDDPQPRF